MTVIVIEIPETNPEAVIRDLWQHLHAVLARHDESAPLLELRLPVPHRAWQDPPRMTLHVRDAADRIVAVLDARSGRDPDLPTKETP